MLTEALGVGDTKMVCVTGKEGGTMLEQVSMPITTPEKTIPKLIEYLQDRETEALGAVIFGPVDAKPESETYGYILDTPKLAWRHRDFLDRLRDELKVSMGLDTDINSSCLGEVAYGCAKRLNSIIYTTIGADVGMGVCINGALLHRMLHPEGGHIPLTRYKDDPVGNICPYHKNCLRGSTNDPSIEARWGKRAVELVDRSEVQEMESCCVAQTLMNYIVFLPPQENILGGGVMHQEQLFPMIRQKIEEILNDYIKTRELEDMDSYIIPAGLHDDQGTTGCVKLGLSVLRTWLPLEDFNTCWTGNR